MRFVLNVAEKNSIAKEISNILSSNNAKMSIKSYSKFNPNYSFQYDLENKKQTMLFTSVSGHIYSANIPPSNKLWVKGTIPELFRCNIDVKVDPTMKQIAYNLKNLAPNADKLIIWTDCDREGEYIGNSIAEIVKGRNKNIKVFRAHFSDVSKSSIKEALQKLRTIDKNQVQSVACRQELDLRVGAAFTRLQTLDLKPIVKGDKKSIISYGPCQFPVLGLIYEKYNEIAKFVKEPFWKLTLKHKKEDIKVDFNWSRERLFSQNPTMTIYKECLKHEEAVVEEITKKPITKCRPPPLDTIELERISSRCLKVSAKVALNTAERLYQKGFISYPRTETNQYPKNFKFNELLKNQQQDPHYQNYIKKLLESPITPSRGSKNDGAHPPIHPLKCGSFLTGLDRQVFDLVARHFIATLSENALANETKVEIKLNKERFSATGVVLKKKGFLEIYPFITWSTSKLPNYTKGERFKPDEFKISEGETSPPELLKEHDLIGLMDKFGIGTDATQAEHIAKIIEREYVKVRQGFLYPTKLGCSLIEGYMDMGFKGVYSPNLRSRFEESLKMICTQSADKNDVLKKCIQEYEVLYSQILNKMHLLVKTVKEYSEGVKTMKKNFDCFDASVDTNVTKKSKKKTTRRLRSKSTSSDSKKNKKGFKEKSPAKKSFSKVNTSKAPRAPRAIRAPRKCRKCGIAGHTSKTCNV